MTKKPISIALRIAEILNDSSEREIAAAVKLLREHGWQSGLLSFVSDAVASCESDVGARKKDQRSQVGRASLKEKISNLQRSDPSTHKIVVDFERRLLDGEILRSSEELRRFGLALSKGFRPGRKRMESISSIISELINLRRDEISLAVEHAESSSASSGSDEFQHLAHYLIEGRGRG